MTAELQPITILEQLTPAESSAGILPVSPDETPADTLERQMLENLLAGDPATIPGDQLPVKHYFATGIYLRELHMPKGLVVIGHKHREDTVNILLKGSLALIENGELVCRKAPYTYVSPAGHRKAAYILEDVIWQNVHPSHETDLDKLEARFIEKSAALQTFETIIAERKALT